MGKKEIIIIGAGGHALVVKEALLLSGEQVVGFVDMVSPQRKGELLNGFPIIGGLQELFNLSKSEEILCAIGFGHCMARFRLISELDNQNISLHTVIHPRAIVSPSALIGSGVYIGPNAVVEAHSNIGDGSIINCGVCACHECVIGRATSICPGVQIGGKTIVGDRTWLGIGVTCIDKIRIGKGSFVGAGSVVVSDIPENSFVVGVPARVIREVNAEF